MPKDREKIKIKEKKSKLKIKEIKRDVEEIKEQKLEDKGEEHFIDEEEFSSLMQTLQNSSISASPVLEKVRGQRREQPINLEEDLQLTSPAKKTEERDIGDYARVSNMPDYLGATDSRKYTRSESVDLAPRILERKDDSHRVRFTPDTSEWTSESNRQTRMGEMINVDMPKRDTDNHRLPFEEESQNKKYKKINL